MCENHPEKMQCLVDEAMKTTGTQGNTPRRSRKEDPTNYQRRKRPKAKKRKELPNRNQREEHPIALGRRQREFVSVLFFSFTTSQELQPEDFVAPKGDFQPYPYEAIQLPYNFKEDWDDIPKKGINYVNSVKHKMNDTQKQKAIAAY